MACSQDSRGHRSTHHQAIWQQTIDRYLERYAESVYRQMPGLKALNATTKDHPSALVRLYDHVLVIPAFDEPVGCLEPVLPPTVERTLVIVVVNVAEDGDRAAIERTQELWQSLRWRSLQSLGDRPDSATTAGGLFDHAPDPSARFGLIAHNTTTTLLVVDCCTEGRQLPPNQGVGFARKIGGDIALAYIAQGIITSDWIHYTDADVVLPEDFFQTTLDLDRQSPHTANATANATANVTANAKTTPDDIAVILYGFRHLPPHRHILLYELSLRYYVTELAAARSPYAFHTIGSLMCVNGLHYAKVRGFPKRKAAEDFYMLNKLAKTGAVVQLQAPIVTLASRLSHRVPFGTGAMMTKLSQSDEFRFYHPAIFQQLQGWMACIEALWPPIDDLLPWLSASQWKDAIWVDCLMDMGLEKTLMQAYRQSRDRHHFRLYLWTWFDAFRTLKFVHYLRDYHYPSLSVENWVGVIRETQKWDLGLVGDVHPTELDLTQLKQINQYFCELEATLEPIVGPTRLVND